MQRYVVLVDPVRAGHGYVTAFREAGVEPVAVLTTSDPALPHRQVRLDDVEHVYAFTGDVAALADELRGYAPICVIPASETGVELADALGELVAPGTGNVPGLTAARRDKAAMAAAAERAGLAHPRQISADDPAVIEAWLAASGLSQARLVVKPPKSAGGDNVHIVAPGGDWRSSFELIQGRTNKLGLVNEAVLVSEFVEGTEFMVDSYSADGRHGLVDVCRYVKRRRGDRIGLYDLIDFLPPDDPEVKEIWPYVQQVLDAVGIRNGCGHTEVILAADGPRLVELAARPAGGGHQMITMLATGSNHITRTVAHRVRGELLDDYQLIQHVCSVVISAPRAGIWRNAEIFDDVPALATFYEQYFAAATGEPVQATDDIYTMLGWVVLASPDSDAVEADYRRLKELELLIDIEPVSGVPA
jgi:biotin carboxylase